MPSPDPIMRPSAQDLAVAPELGVLAALDATLVTASYQLAAENPDLSPQALARGHIPDPSVRLAALLISRILDLRIHLRQYADAAIRPLTDGDEPF